MTDSSPFLPQLTQLLKQVPEYPRLLEALAQGQTPATLSGLASIHRAHWAAGLAQDTGRPLVLVCPDEEEARRMGRDFAALTGQDVPLLPARDFCFYPGTFSRQWEHQRLTVLDALGREACPVLAVTADGLMQRTLPPDVLTQARRTLSPGQVQDPEELTDALAQLGYTRCDPVEGVGQFALRGGILDVFSPGMEQPVRMEFWGDEIDSLGAFDPVSQRRTEALDTCTILPAGEVLVPPDQSLAGPPDTVLHQVYDRVTTAVDYLPPQAIVLICDTPRCLERGKNYFWQLSQDLTTLLEQQILTGSHPVFAQELPVLCQQLAQRTLIYLDTFLPGALPTPQKTLLSVSARPLAGYGAHFESIVEDLRAYQKEHTAVVVLAGTRRKADLLQTMLREKDLPCAVDEALTALPQPGALVLAVGSLSSGFDYPDGGCAVLTEGQGTARPKHRAARPTGQRQKLESFTDLTPGDLVVHEYHGIGRFVGMSTLTVDGSPRDYIKLQFAGADVLYVPALQLDLVCKYIGSGDDPDRKRLSKLGGTEWEKSKARAKKSAKDMTKGLIQLYAQRQRLEGHAFSPDSPWQEEFESLFPYPETEDQLRCTAEIKRDMESTVPMDRLLCGDVGYGKTEVAFRAIMKCILDGKQAAMLTPTTVLTQQHYLTACQRFASFPNTIEVLSRFRTPAQVRDVLRRTEAGEIDLLIGTHKLLSKNLHFHDLGLLVVDEEQRFGVSHKETLKKLARQVDVLTLSATPIPRTLNMALSGLRDMSTLDEPPTNRQPVQTYVMEHNWGLLADAMRRELDRGGQVYYLHNSIGTIDRTAAKIQALLGEGARIGVAHGKMNQEQLNGVMSRMADGDLDVLVCTTIIETGIDLPNVNTLIIENAEQMGLSQLHQLRGRVGRSNRRASAYMTYRPAKILTETQTKRLTAIRAYAAFGSGFQIAMRDLEIRGAGNLLGPEQSGFLTTVGYDLYLRLLEEAVLEEQGQPAAPSVQCTAELAVPAALPERYIPTAEARMDLYRRIARLHSQEDADDLTDEMIDRYGDPPKSAMNLLTIALLRSAAAKLGVAEISQKNDLLRLSLPQPDLRQVSQVCGLEHYRRRLLFSASSKPYLALRLKKGDDVLKLTRQLLRDLADNAS